jgi:uncharacterized damage-inducible protein DinB
MIDPFTIDLLWRYMTHADDQILVATETLDDDAYFREHNFSLGSVHKMLAHCIDAQRIWLTRLNELPNPPGLPADQVTRATIWPLWAKQHEGLLSFASRQTADSLSAIFRFRNRRGDPFEMTRGACMLHVSDHATYHRGQLNSMIKLAGGSPSDVSLYAWSLSEGFGQAGWSQ